MISGKDKTNRQLDRELKELAHRYISAKPKESFKLVVVNDKGEEVCFGNRPARIGAIPDRPYPSQLRKRAKRRRTLLFRLRIYFLNIKYNYLIKKRSQSIDAGLRKKNILD
jgi:hypothetical protein